MNNFNKKEFMYFLPENFKGLSKSYIVDCVLNEKIQDKWIPGVGDIIVGETGNIFVISSEHVLTKKLGGTLYFFGGSLCSRDGGSMANSTCSYVMNKDGVRPNDLDVFNVAKQSEFRYVPYPHEI